MSTLFKERVLNYNYYEKTRTHHHHIMSYQASDDSTINDILSWMRSKTCLGWFSGGGKNYGWVFQLKNDNLPTTTSPPPPQYPSKKVHLVFLPCLVVLFRRAGEVVCSIPTAVSIPGVELIPKIRTRCISGIFAMIDIKNIPQLTTI